MMPQSIWLGEDTILYRHWKALQEHVGHQLGKPTEEDREMVVRCEDCQKEVLRVRRPENFGKLG